MARKSKRRPREQTEWRESGWDALPDRIQHAVCVLALIVVAFGFYAPVIFSDRSLIGSDTVQWRAMAEFVLEHREATGEPGLWAPNAFAGMPAYMISYAEQIPGLDDIPTFLRGLIWPASHFIFLLLGTYLLVVFLTRNKLAGLFSAFAYGLTTYIAVILVAGHNSKFIAMSFAPWLVLAFAYALRRPRLLSALLFAITLAVNLRAGHVQITYYVTILLAVWWIVELIAAIRHRSTAGFARATGWLALGSVLALLMVAQPYLANMEYKRYTIRGAVEGGGEGLDWSYAMAWSQGVGELVTLIAADAYGGASPTYWGPKTFTSGPHYVGIITLVLAVLGLARCRRRIEVPAFGVAVLLMILFSLGEFFGTFNRIVYEYLPLFNAFRVPETWLGIAAIGIAVLAGFGLNAAGRRETDASERARTDRTVYATVGGAAGLIAVLLLFGDVFFDFSRPGEAQQITQQVMQQYPEISPDDPRVTQFVRETLADLRDERTGTYSSELMRALIFLLLAGALLILFRREKIPAWAMQAGLVLLVLVDLWGVGRRYFNEDYLVPARDSEAQIATYDFDRYIIEQRQRAGGHGHFRVLSLEAGNPFSRARPSYHHESLGGYHGAKLRLYQDYIDELFIDPTTGAPSERALDLLSTRFIVAGGGLPGTQPVYQGEQTQLYVLENPDALPRAFLVGETEVVDSDAEALELLRGGDIDLRRKAILHAPIEADVAAVDTMSTADVQLESFTARHIRWRVNTDSPRLLVASEIYYPAGWKAYVDGDAVEIHRANYLLRAVPVPEGEHEVEMRFEPASHRAGVWISGLSALLVYGLTAALLALSWHRRHTAKLPEPAADRPAGVEAT